MKINYYMRVIAHTYAGRHHSFIMIGIHTYGIALQIESELAVFYVFQFVLVQIRPSPNASIDYVRETLASCHLQSAIESSLDGDAFAGMCSISSYCSDQTVQLVALLLLIKFYSNQILLYINHVTISNSKIIKNCKVYMSLIFTA